MLGLRGKKVCKEQEFLGILSSFVWEFSPWLCLHNRLGIPPSTKPHPSKGSVPNRCKAGGRWRKASKQQALLAPNRHIMEGNSTTYMYICFKIRGEVWKNCKSWERNQDCTEEVSRQPARYHLQETLGASHHLLQEKRHPGTQESRDPGINGSTSPCISFTCNNTASNPSLRFCEQPRCHSTCCWLQGTIQPGCQMTQCLLWWGGAAKGGRALVWWFWEAKVHFLRRLSKRKTPSPIHK